MDFTPLLRLYARYRLWRLARLDPAGTQEDQLLGLLRQAEATRFGRDHAFARITSVSQFQKQVPLRRYEAFWEEYWRRDFPRLRDCAWPGEIPYFALTSGTTTGVTKYIPLSREMIRSNVRAAGDVLVHHVANRPQSRVLGGLSFLLGGSTSLKEEAPGIRSGDLSGIAAFEAPRWTRSRIFPPTEVSLIPDWEEKIARLAPLSLGKDIRLLSGVPSWLLAFFDRLDAIAPCADDRAAGRLRAHYPNLELLVHGGVNFAPYRARFKALLKGGHAELREVYPASEGFIAVADRGDGEGLRLLIDNGLFFEFVPAAELGDANPRRHWVGNAEINIDYAVVVSTCAGAWAYVLGDTVRFIDLNPPRILVTGRTSYALSGFGEHLIEEEIETAVAAAAEAIGASVSDFTVGPEYPSKPGQAGRHCYFVEFVGETPEERRLAAFARTLDHRLCSLNSDYKDHRTHDLALKAPKVMAAKPGAFARWMKERGQLGGQHKAPRVVTDPDLLKRLAARLCLSVK
jgi:hypothetical protein